MESILHRGEHYILRSSVAEDVPVIRDLVNAAYKELADMGLNYTATYQDEEATRQRIGKGKAFVLEIKGKIVATILFTKKNYFTQKNTAYVGQLAVQPQFKKQGLGSLLRDYCENLALVEGFDGMQLDTAQPAKHLVDWYLKRGYQIVGDAHWEGKTYSSYIFEKDFATRVTLISGSEAGAVVDPFYELEEKSHRARPSDLFFVAYSESKVAGVCRFCVEEGVPLLRSMVVHKPLRSKGIGRKILQGFSKHLDEHKIGPTYCIPYGHLDKFYGLIGFKIVDEAHAPQFLRERIKGYRERNPETFIIMRRE